jgi:Flp pilus assembly protein TadD
MKVGINGMQQAKREVIQAQRELAFAVKLDEIRYRKWLWVLEAGRGGMVSPWLAASEYRAAFAAFDLDLIALAPDVAAWRIAESGVKTEIIAAVDDWALYEGFSAHNEHLLDIVRRADPGGWLDRLRDPKVRTDVTAVTRLANDADVQLLSPTALSTLAELMNRNGLDPSPVLRRARVAHPSEFELAFALGQWHRGHARYQQIAQYEAACALRPDNTTVWMQLADALKTWGDDEGAIAAYRKIIELEPKYAHAHTNLGNFHFQKKNYADCILCAKYAISADPKRSNGYALLGRALQATGDISGARVALTEAARLDATWAEMLAQLPPVPLAPPPRPK